MVISNFHKKKMDTRNLLNRADKTIYRFITNSRDRFSTCLQHKPTSSTSNPFSLNILVKNSFEK